jgi:hypothetical protein
LFVEMFFDAGVVVLVEFGEVECDGQGEELEHDEQQGES